MYFYRFISIDCTTVTINKYMSSKQMNHVRFPFFLFIKEDFLQNERLWTLKSVLFLKCLFQRELKYDLTLHLTVNIKHNISTTLLFYDFHFKNSSSDTIYIMRVDVSFCILYSNAENTIDELILYTI